MTIEEVQENEKLKFWYMHITRCSQEGKSISAYCKENGLTPSTFYVYKRRIREILLNQPQAVVMIPDKASSAAVEGVTQNHLNGDDNDPVIITKGKIRIELPADSPVDKVTSLVKALIC